MPISPRRRYQAGPHRSLVSPTHAHRCQSGLAAIFSSRAGSTARREWGFQRCGQLPDRQPRCSTGDIACGRRRSARIRWNASRLQRVHVAGHRRPVPTAADTPRAAPRPAYLVLCSMGGERGPSEGPPVTGAAGSARMVVVCALGGTPPRPNPDAAPRWCATVRLGPGFTLARTSGASWLRCRSARPSGTAAARAESFCSGLGSCCVLATSSPNSPPHSGTHPFPAQDRRAVQAPGRREPPRRGGLEVLPARGGRERLGAPVPVPDSAPSTN